MRAAALDLGTVRVGLAVSDELGSMAHPRPYLDGRNREQLLATLAALAEREGIVTFVVGLPRHLDGREGKGARRARQLASRLADATGATVTLVDEWLTTREASARLGEAGTRSREQRERVDSAAAALLLQGWLDARR